MSTSAMKPVGTFEDLKAIHDTMRRKMEYEARQSLADLLVLFIYEPHGHVPFDRKLHIKKHVVGLWRLAGKHIYIDAAGNLYKWRFRYDQSTFSLSHVTAMVNSLKSKFM